MSFGLLKHFKDAKKNFADKAPLQHLEHVILGQDLGAVLKLMELRREHPEAGIKLITNRPLNKKALLETYEYGVSLLRSPTAVENVYRKHHNARLLPQNLEPIFYKDGKFHDFGGRAKSMELLPGEEFFNQKGYRLELESLFHTDDWANLDTILNEAQDIRIIEAIEKTEVNDLVNKNEWLLTFKDFTGFTCEYLYLSLSPKKFLSHLAHKEKLGSELVDVCTSTKVQAALAVSWLLNKEIHPEARTIFAPQSMTHEWGHFVIEFESFDHQKNEQMCHVLILIHEDEPQTEDLASKIKLMKRVVERIFPDIEAAITKEYIRFDEEMLITDVKDDLLEQINFDYPTLRFLGQMSPMQPVLTCEKFLARVLLN